MARCLRRRASPSSPSTARVAGGRYPLRSSGKSLVTVHVAVSQRRFPMTRTVLIAFVGLVIASSVYAQTTAEIIEQALAAAPGRAREGAAVIQWNADYTLETLKEGTNTWVCYHRSDEARRQPFAVQCTSTANLDRVAQNRKFRAESADADEERAMLTAAEENGTRVQPEYHCRSETRHRVSSPIRIRVRGSPVQLPGRLEQRSVERPEG